MGNESSRLLLMYPSGQHLEVRGKLCRAPEVEHSDTGLVLAVLLSEDVSFFGRETLPEGSALVFDPRAIIADLDSRVIVYRPRGIPAEEHAEWVRGWLREHPEWDSDYPDFEEMQRPRPAALLGVQKRDAVHCYRAQCSDCGRKTWLGPRQHDVVTQSEGDARVYCDRCARRRFAAGEAAGIAHLGNPELGADGSWPAGQMRFLRRGRS